MALFSFPMAGAATDNVTLDSKNPDHKPERELDKFRIDGEDYQRCSKLQQKVIAKKRLKKSLAWKVGERLLRLSDQRTVYYCYICERQHKAQSLPVINGNTGALNHLRDAHNLDKSGCTIPKVSENQPTLDRKVFTAVTTYDYDEFKRLFIRWIVYCFIAFRMVENQYFREFVCFLNKGLGALLPRAAATIRWWIKEEFDKRKALLNTELKEALSSIHLSFDLWTSPNFYSIVSIYGHFINKQGERRTQLLAFRRLHGDHGGENQAAVLLEVIEEYGIDEKLGYFMCDNAKSNDTAVSVVLKKLRPNWKQAQRKGRRLRCFGHVANLCARAMILGKGAGKALAEVERKVSKGALEAVDRFWRGRGAVGRLHNIVRYIRWTPQRREAFARCKKGGKLNDFDELQVSKSL
jgi:hypothetical protein